MGRVIKSEVVAIRCELATRRRSTPVCDQIADVWPSPAAASWQELFGDLQRLVNAGWVLVLTGKLRAYCPEHATRATECTCRTHPMTEHLCTVHGDTANLVWAADNTPDQVRSHLTTTGATA